MIDSRLKKEKCNSCNRNIYIGQPITECVKCLHSVIHTKCFSKSGYKNINSKFYCNICCIKTTYRYNPYKKIIDSDPLNDDFENFY